MEVVSTFAVAGVTTGGGHGCPRRVGLDLASGEAIAARGAGARIEPVADGYVLSARHYGAHHVAGDGLLVRCSPPPVAPWRWQRFLIGQVLPLAAALQRLEPLHASAVAFGDRSLALTGPVLAGKTSLAARLVLRGARLVADDVLAIEPVGVGIAAHPGAAILNLRHGESRCWSAGERRRLGRVLGRDRVATRLLVAREERALRLSALYFLDVRPTARRVRIEPLWPPDPAVLLAASFTTVLRTAERIASQLDAHARLAASTPLFRLIRPPSAVAADVAAALERHADRENLL